MTEAPLTREAFAAAFSVSRETLLRLETYLTLLARWQSHINLVSESTLPDAWRRHILDSAQLLPHLPAPTEADSPIVDLGSGAGFPGLVLAILGVPGMVLVESDARKVAFLREVVAQTETKATIQACRAESAAVKSARAVTARGFAPLVRLLHTAVPFLGVGGAAVLLKGKRHQEEMEEARATWQFTVQSFPSRTDPAGVVLRLTDIRRLSFPPGSSGADR